MTKEIKRARSLLAMVMFSLALLMMSPTTVFAKMDRPNAVADIMNDERFTGAIDSISWLTGRIDHWFTIIISVTAFFIISSALLKNVCAGAYCANHKFWDKVAEAHEHNEAATLASLVQGVKGIPQMTAGGVKEALLCIVPNIKAFTDFDDADIEPRQYFSKAIPQMLLCVMIGIFIYNGYYRDTASMVGSMGSEICVRVFASVDPATFLDKITQTSKTPPNIYSEDPTLQGKDAYELSMAIYKACLSSTKNANYQDKEQLMRESELTASNVLGDSEIKKFYAVGRKYDYRIGSVKVVLVPSKTAKRPVVKNVDGVAETKFSVVTYQNTPAPTSGQTDNTSMYISFTLTGGPRSTDKSVFTEIVAEGSSGQGVDSHTKSAAWTLDVVSHPINGVTYQTNDGSIKFSKVQPSAIIKALANAAGCSDIPGLCNKILGASKVKGVESITYKSHSISDGGNGTAGYSDTITGDKPVPISMGISFTYKDGSSDEVKDGSMTYTFNVTFNGQGGDSVPDLTPVKFETPSVDTDGSSGAIEGATNTTTPSEA